ncbi:MAG: GDSL-type esterase/lipase family protein [Actinomycetota bacterium]|nr:GDSL-type esterase/lipase family protein [Actinomycetota bacterium]
MPTFASREVEGPRTVVDGHYCQSSAWRTARFPTWVAINVGAGPSRLLLSWNSGKTGDYTSGGKNESYGIPASYTIETSADSTNGADGTWQLAVDVQGNFARTRAHSFPFTGAAWVRMTVRGVVPRTAEETLLIDEIDIHDASAGTEDTIFFMGASNTAAAFLRCDASQPSYAEHVHRGFPRYFPAMIDGGVGDVTSEYGVRVIDSWLADNSDYQYWAIAYGTNDAWQAVSPAAYEENLQFIIDKVKAAGKQPILARIPYALKGPKDENVQRLNEVIDRLTTRNRLPQGPDLYTWFKDHSEELGPDGVHVTNVGAASINRLWFEVLGPRYGAAVEPPVAAARAGGDGAPPPAPLQADAWGVLLLPRTRQARASQQSFARFPSAG